MADGKPGRIAAVLIADDHEVFRFGLASLLRHSLGVATIVEAESFEAALARLEDPRIGLAIFDLGMPGLGGQGSGRGAPATAGGEGGRAQRLRRTRGHPRGPRGRRSRLYRQERAHRSLDRASAVRAVRRDLRSSGARRAPGPIEKVEVRKPGALPIETLSDRQRQVLKGVVEGMSNKEIARSLALSEGTVKMHLAALFRALGRAIAPTPRRSANRCSGNPGGVSVAGKRRARVRRGPSTPRSAGRRRAATAPRRYGRGRG